MANVEFLASSRDGQEEDDEIEGKMITTNNPDKDEQLKVYFEQSRHQNTKFNDLMKKNKQAQKSTGVDPKVQDGGPTEIPTPRKQVDTKLLDSGAKTSENEEGPEEASVEIKDPATIVV